MVQTDFGTLIQELQELGVYDYFLPFLLIFAIVFAILEKTGIFGDKTNINVVVSLVIGLLLIVQQPIVNIINMFLPKASLIIIVILIAMIVISLIGGNPTSLTGPVFSIGVIVIVIALLWALSPSLGWSLPFDISERTRNLILLLLIFLALPLFLITRKEKTEGGVTKFLKGLEKGFKGQP